MKIKALIIFLVTLLLSTITQAQTILIVGDSISAGFGIDPAKGWVKLLEKKLHEEGEHYKVINSSISGDTTTNGLARLPLLLEKHQPNITIIELGGNDGLRATPPKNIYQNLSQMIELSQAQNSKVLLVGIQLPPNYGEQYLNQFMQVYTNLDQNYDIVLLPSIVANTGGNDALMQNDGIHPNEAGQPIIMEDVWQKLSPLLKSPITFK